MPDLPDCPSCAANASLKPTRADGPLVWAECSVCAKTCLVKDGRVVHPVPVRFSDAAGVPMFDP